MIQEFIKEYRKLKDDYDQHLFDDKLDEDAFWLLEQLDNLIDRYITELNIQSLKELNNENIKPDQNIS